MAYCRRCKIYFREPIEETGEHDCPRCKMGPGDEEQREPEEKPNLCETCAIDPERCGCCDESVTECELYEKQPCDICQGTGIGQHGDPDTSKCWKCGRK
ncbi:MAG: hypothetical protein ACTSX8_05855 [Alphaproteobacteria bacterium]